MSIEHRRTEAVFAIVTDLFADGRDSIRPGDVSEVLREQNAPIGSWQVRAEFSLLEADGRLVCDEETGDWHLGDVAGPSAQQDEKAEKTA